MPEIKMPEIADSEALAHPQAMFKLLRDAAPAVPMEDLGMTIIGGDRDVRAVLHDSAVFSSGVEAVSIGQIRPLLPLQIDPPEHKKYRKLLDPIFAPRQVNLMEDQVRQYVRGMVADLAGLGHANVHDSLSSPMPTTVFLELLGLPVSRLDEFIALKDGIIRPPAKDAAERITMANETGQKIYAILEEVTTQRTAEPQDDLISDLLSAEVDGERLTVEDVIDICYLFFLAGLDTVTASLDCMFAFLAGHPEHRQQLVDDPSLIPPAIEEMLRWESPVQGVIRITTQDTEISGCPIAAHQPVVAMIGSANTDERCWDDVDSVSFTRSAGKHIAFGGGAHRCLGSHLARLELRIVLEEWHAAIPYYRLADDLELAYTPDLRSITNLELVW